MTRQEKDELKSKINSIRACESLEDLIGVTARALDEIVDHIERAEEKQASKPQGDPNLAYDTGTTGYV